jgi:ATP-dependent protease ClpP protease subunit
VLSKVFTKACRYSLVSTYCAESQISTQIVGSLLALEAFDEKEDIRLYINSSGEDLSALIGWITTLHA